MTKSIFNGSGYFLSDNRASGGKLEQDDLLGCGHCPKPVKAHKWKLQGGMCFVCAKALCFECYSKVHITGCTGPDIDRLMRAVDEEYRKQQNAKVLGI